MFPMKDYDADKAGNVMVAPPNVEERPTSSYTTSTDTEVSDAKRAIAVNIIGWTLQVGVIISAAVILLGMILLPLRPGGFSAQRLLTFPQNLGAVWSGLLILQPQAIITLGLLLLIATPVMRVAVSIAVFLVEKDRKFVVITLLVLAILLISMFVVGSLVPKGVHGNVASL